MNTLIYIAGTTAIGKTALSIKLAKHFGCEIISCDSRQFFKEMTIGTAVPNKEELESVPHHFVQHINIHQEYNIGSFENEALEKLEELFLKNKTQIMVGGSGMYADAVMKGLDYFPKVDANIRKELTEQLEEKGIEYLQEQLKELDIESHNTISIDNPQRLIRALEICIGSGNTYSSYKNKPKKPRNFNKIIIVLSADREIIYERINKRVDIMIANGLLEETKELYPNKELNALQTVGYREIFEHYKGNIELDFAISEIKKNTRRFAKRQITWFKRYNDAKWFDYKENPNTIIEYIENYEAH